MTHDEPLTPEKVDAHERFTRLFLAHEPEVLRAVLPFVPHRADAREIVQEAAIALWRNFDEYDPARPFAAWACAFARIEVRRFLRSAARRRQLTERAAELLIAEHVSSVVGIGEQENHLRACLGRLPIEQRGLIEAYYLNQRRVEVIAVEVGRSVEAVYKTLQRVRRMLADCVREKMSAEAKR